MTLASKVIIFSLKIMDQFMIWITPDQNKSQPLSPPSSMTTVGYAKWTYNYRAAMTKRYVCGVKTLWG